MVSDPLASWRDGLYFLLLGLSDVDLKGSDVRLDYSRESLGPLERVVLDRFASPGELMRPARRETVEGLVAYIGETLMRTAGGRWSWGRVGSGVSGGAASGVSGDSAISRHEDGPVATADPVLGLEPVSPLSLLADVVDTRTGDRLARVFDRWADAVARHRSTHPGWQPDKQRTMADPPPSLDEELRSWLDAQREQFPAWVSDYAPGTDPETDWSFAPETLAALEAVALRTVRSAPGLGEPQFLGFRDGAAWYLGETFRRNLGGRWVQTRKPGRRNFPRVMGLGPRQTARITPVLVLEAALEGEEHLVDRFAGAAGPLRA